MTEIKTLDSLFSTLVEIPIPNQARSRAALTRFVQAGEQLLAENRFEEASVAEIARAAESSVGSFYRLLGDKETLLLLLLQQFFQHIEALVNEELAPQRWIACDIEDIVKGLIKILVISYNGHAGALRAMVLRSSKDAEFRKRVHELNALINRRLAELLIPHLANLRHPEPEKALQYAGHMLLGILNQFTMAGQLNENPEPELIVEMQRLFISYLQIESQ
jgi:AcrR family transcriptional regulator